MEESAFAVAQEVARRIVEARFPDQLTCFDVVWNAFAKFAGRWLERPLREWALPTERGRLVSGLGLTSASPRELDMIQAMSVVIAVILTAWRTSPQPTRAELKENIRQTMGELKTPKGLQSFLRDTISELYGPVREEILHRTMRMYRVTANDFEGELREDSLMREKEKKRKLWVRKSDSGLETEWKGDPLNLSHQLMHALFLFAKDHGKAKPFDDLLRSLHLNAESRLYTVKSKLADALGEAAPELKERLIVSDYREYGLNLVVLQVKFDGIPICHAIPE